VEIKTLKAQFTANINEFKSGVDKAKTKLKEFGDRAHQVGEKIKEIGAKIGDWTKKLALGITALAGSMTALTFGVAASGDKIAKMAKKTGLATESLSQLAYAAELSGTSIEDIGTGVRMLQRAVAQSDRGMALYTDTFRMLGVNIYDTNGQFKSTEQTFLEVADALNKLEDDSLKTDAAMTLFGRSGTNMLPMFEDGAAGIREMAQEATDLGIVWSGPAAAAAEIFNDDFLRLKKTFWAISIELGQRLMPILNRFFNGIKRWLDEHPQAIENFINATTRFLAGFFGWLLWIWENILGPIFVAVAKWLNQDGGQAIDNFWVGVQEFTVKVWNAILWIWNFLVTTWNNIVSWWDTEIKPKLDAIWNDEQDNLRGIIATCAMLGFEMGKAIVNGILTALEENWPLILQWMWEHTSPLGGLMGQLGKILNHSWVAEHQVAERILHQHQ
jgi:hypothetical protein